MKGPGDKEFWDKMTEYWIYEQIQKEIDEENKDPLDDFDDDYLSDDWLNDDIWDESVEEEQELFDVTVTKTSTYNMQVKARDYFEADRYEIIKATHDAANEVCFIDLAIYKVFVKHFGNPGLPYRFGDGSGEVIDNDGLNAESVLKSFGYSVAQNVGLSDKQRQDILADVVDLGMLSVSKVIWYLELFIRLHPGSRFYSAREKWEQDEYFIANYSENPERFYIT